MRKLFKCKHGIYVDNPEDKQMHESMMHYGEYKTNEIDLLIQLIEQKDMVISINSEPYQLIPFARKIFPTGKILAFEPNESKFKYICANIALNSMQNIYPTRYDFEDGKTKLDKFKLPNIKLIKIKSDKCKEILNGAKELLQQKIIVYLETENTDWVEYIKQFGFKIFKHEFNSYIENNYNQCNAKEYNFKTTNYLCTNLELKLDNMENL